jgi:hypothetical protein
MDDAIGTQNRNGSGRRHHARPDVDQPASTGEGDLRKVLVVTYVVRRSDLFWMYLGARVAQITVLTPGLLLVLLGLDAVVDPKGGLGTAAFFLAAGVGLLVAAPAYLFWLQTAQSGTKNLVGRKVVLQLDETGVAGWPVAPYLDRSWSVINRARSLRGVITLPFRPGYTREGWVAIPERALTPPQLKALRELLQAQGKL